MTLLPMLILVKEFLKKSILTGLWIRNSDPHLNEYIGEADEFLLKITNFTGSNAMILITENKGYFLTDGRYTIQAHKEIKDKYWIIFDDLKKFEEAIKKISGKIGLDRRYFSMRSYEELKMRFDNFEFVGKEGMIDEIWENRPKRIFNEIIDLEEINLKEILQKDNLKDNKFFNQSIIDLKTNVSGSNRVNKIRELRKFIGEHDFYITAALDEIAWILNLRGWDIKDCPIFYSYLVVSSEEILLFTNQNIKIDDVSLRNYEKFEDYIQTIKNKNVFINNDINAYVCEVLVTNGNKVEKTEYISQKKAIKNEIELIGFKYAHLIDAISLIKLFTSLEKNFSDSGLKKVITEKEISEQLLKIKENFVSFVSPSFESISAYGENGAIIHHKGSDDLVSNANLYLLDCGSQFFFGTTDITRTLHFGTPSDEQKKDFTTVLKGQLNAMMKPSSMNLPLKSKHIDILAREPIKAAGYDFKHSTGHGVGHFLNVHENPPFISNNESNLFENMVFSVEPGIYKEGEYGIRIEDLVFTKKSTTRDSLELINMTLTPLQLKMIDLKLLDENEINYLNEMNDLRINILKDYFKDGEDEYDFLLRNTRTLSKD